MFSTLAFTLSVALLSYAQDAANNTAVGIEAIEAHFNNSGIVPDLLKQFSPSAILTLDYNGVGQVQPGQQLTVDQVKPTPSLTVTSTSNLTGNYTLAMVDADAVGANQSEGQTRHWLANSVTVSGITVVLDRAVNITDYASPLPAQGSGAHRYVVILYEQPSSFAPSGDLANPGQPVAKYDVNQYASSSGLGSIVAATYYTVEQGTASTSVSATSPVVTSTLPTVPATAAGSGASTAPQPSGSGSPSSGGSHRMNVGFTSILALFGLGLVLVI